MRMFGFNPPQERVDPRFWTANVTNLHNTGRFVRNAVLDGATYGSGDLVPSYIKTADLIHPYVGSYNQYLESTGVYGRAFASAAESSVAGILNEGSKTDAQSWTPGGNGTGSWFSVSLPEAALADRYIVRTKAAEAPLSWTLQGSLDGTTWTDIHTVSSSGTWTAALETKEFTIPEETRGMYLWYKLNITGSNATTMRIYRFRLLRPANICPLGDFYIDASVANPLTLSFMDGFNGGVPVDHIATITSPQIMSIFDELRVPLDPSIAGSLAFNLYAVRHASGEVTFEVSGYGGSPIEYLPGRMKATQDRGFQAFSGSYSHWGSSSSVKSGTYILGRVDESPFYVSSITLYNPSNGTVYLYVSYNNLDYTLAGKSTTSTPYSATINRFVYKIKNVNTASSATRLWGSTGLYRYRSINGVLYEKCTNPATDWTPVQKIQLASGYISDGEVYGLNPKSTLLSQWQTGVDLAQSIIE
jgi:hypothetical protein